MDESSPARRPLKLARRIEVLTAHEAALAAGSHGTLNTLRLVASILLLALIPVGIALPALGALTLATAVIVLLVAYESVRFRDVRLRLRFRVHGEH